MKRTTQSISRKEARRIALAAQGFDRRRPKRADVRQMRRVLQELGVIQIDFVNVLVPAHYLVPFSRLGPYDRNRFDELVYHSGEFTEQWAHEASIVPVETWPRLSHRRDSHRVRPWGFEKFLDKNPAYARRVLRQCRREGPLTAADVPSPEGTDRRIKEAWLGSVPRATLEAHFGRGKLAVAHRESNFARAYDMPERVIPAEHRRRRVAEEDAQRELVEIAARAHGVATVSDLADYFRLPTRDARARVGELVEADRLWAVSVEGWSEAAYAHPDARVPRAIDACALISPFDPLVWTRPRGERVFDFHYRIEIYVPAAKRRWGYYVLPFLLGDRLVARVDLKADRPERRLVVQAAHVERGADRNAVAGALAAELQTLAGWLDLDSVGVTRRGTLGRALAAAMT